MPAKRLSMRKIKEVLRLKWDKDLSNRQITRACRKREESPVMATELERIAAKARCEPELRFTLLAHHVTWDRVEKFSLVLEPTKTKLVEFGRFAAGHACKRGGMLGVRCTFWDSLCIARVTEKAISRLVFARRSLGFNAA